MERNMEKKRAITIISVAVALFALLLAGCAASDQDRGGGRTFINTDTAYDATEDADEVILVRNADDFPNFALICHNGNAYVTTRTLTNGGLVPDPQRTQQCLHTREDPS